MLLFFPLYVALIFISNGAVSIALHSITSLIALLSLMKGLMSHIDLWEEFWSVTVRKLDLCCMAMRYWIQARCMRYFYPNGYDWQRKGGVILPPPGCCWYKVRILVVYNRIVCPAFPEWYQGKVSSTLWMRDDLYPPFTRDSERVSQHWIEINLQTRKLWS